MKTRRYVIKFIIVTCSRQKYVPSSCPCQLGTWKPDGRKGECGLRTVLGNIIVGGTLAKLGQFPHMAALMVEDSNGELVFACGGSVINRWYVLTVADCVHDYFGKQRQVK